MTTSTSSGTESRNSTSSARRTAVPVGLFGVQMKISRVAGVIAAAIAGRSSSWLSVTGTRTDAAPVICVTIG